MAITRVALLGAESILGPAVLDALLAANMQVTVLKRASSKSKDSYPKGVHVVRVEDAFEVELLTQALKGQDAMVVTIKGSQTDIQYRLAQACVKAGVQRFIPADFGSCDSSSAWTQDLVPLYKHKTALREKLIKLAEEHQSFSWSSIVCGHFFDMDPHFLHLWIKEQRADILNDGEVKWSTSTLVQTARAIARILQKSEETRNQVLYIHSFLVSQNEVCRAFEDATNSTWTRNQLDAKQYEVEQKKKADAGDREAVEDLVWLLGTLDGNWESRDAFAMEKLDLQEEDLASVVKKVVQDHS